MNIVYIFLIGTVYRDDVPFDNVIELSLIIMNVSGSSTVLLLPTGNNK